MPLIVTSPVAEKMYSLRTLTHSDVSQFRELRLAGLRESPAAFGQTAEEFEQMSEQELAAWIGPTQDKFIVGAFDELSKLVGIIGVNRQSRERIRHKAVIWGVYVTPECRGQGISKSLLKRLIDDIGQIPGLQQLQLCVATSQGAAESLYRSTGFQEFGIEPRALRVDDRFVDELHMWMPLGAS